MNCNGSPCYALARPTLSPLYRTGSPAESYPSCSLSLLTLLHASLSQVSARGVSPLSGLDEDLMEMVLRAVSHCSTLSLSFAVVHFITVWITVTLVPVVIAVTHRLRISVGYFFHVFLLLLLDHVGTCHLASSTVS